MDRAALRAAWENEERQPFAGWDFSYLNGWMVEQQPPWSCMDRAAALLRQSTSVLDIDTGGGERFLRLREHWPSRVTVTEGYPPNVALARERLSTYGVRVVELEVTDDAPMPFADGDFDLVLNRHGALNPDEIARILARGGTFLTQQVHGLWAYDLVAYLGVVLPDTTAGPERYLDRLVRAGLEVVDTRDWNGALVFTDVGAIVYYLKVVPWLVPGFAVSRHADALFALQQRLERAGGLSFTARKYLSEARKAA